MNKILRVSLLLAAIIVIAYCIGPQPLKPEYKQDLPVVSDLKGLDLYVTGLEAKHKVKPGNNAEIVWTDSVNKAQTEYVIVYLHGFSASREEGNPVHYQLAKKLHANLYLSRLADHGIDTVAPMLYFTPERLWESGKQALVIGEKLGRKVILVGTSTGGTLALQLAAAYPDKVNALILISPNIAINDNTAFILNDPWGLQIARKVIGGTERTLEGKSTVYQKFWYTHYRLESVVQLEEYLETTMTKQTFNKVRQPLLLLYYYKNKQEQDPVVKVRAMLKMFDALRTPKDLKQKLAIPNGGNHVLGSYITSKDLPAVELGIDKFIQRIVK